MARFQRKPQVLEAWQFQGLGTGFTPLFGGAGPAAWPQWLTDGVENGKTPMHRDRPGAIWTTGHALWLTAESRGALPVLPGDWVVWTGSVYTVIDQQTMDLHYEPAP